MPELFAMLHAGLPKAAKAVNVAGGEIPLHTSLKIKTRFLIYKETNLLLSTLLILFTMCKISLNDPTYPHSCKTESKISI